MKNNKNHIRLVFSVMMFAGLLSSAKLYADVKLPAIFSDHMVLQQQSSVAVWGLADAGEHITVMGNWKSKPVSVTADATGNWKIMLQTPKAGGPYSIEIKGSNTIELKDVLIGEVWVCSGQSNMVYSLKASDHAKEEIASADRPTIRYFSVKRQYGLGEFKDCPGSVWEKTTPATAGGFSAVAYYFAKKIQQELNVPVGIVYSAWGGTPAEAWTPEPVLKNDSVLHQYIGRWKTIQDNVGKDSAEYHKKMAQWKTDSTSSKKPAEPQTLYYYNRPWREPSVLFNGMIKPVIPYGIKGVLWYQGESNVGYADEYYKLFSSMINSWREQWGNRPTLPFYFVQIASYKYNDMNAAALVRDAQYQVTQKLAHTGVAVTVDVGNMKDIHYTHKKEVGDRLALIALAKDYGGKKIYKGPEFKNASVHGEKVTIVFNNTASPLTMKGDSLKGFELGYRLEGTDSINYVRANASIEGNKIIVWNEKTDRPVGVRYAWLFPGEANLFNKEGLPAFPFRSGLK